LDRTLVLSFFSRKILKKYASNKATLQDEEFLAFWNLKIMNKVSRIDIL
jgi:hypothetical protein